MKFKNRLKRVADALEKLGVAGIAVAVFQGNTAGFLDSDFFLGYEHFPHQGGLI